MTHRSLVECYRIVAEAINLCSLPGEPIDTPAADWMHMSFEQLGFDSVAFMEFCISIHLETGIEMTVGRADELGSPAAVARFLTEPPA